MKNINKWFWLGMLAVLLSAPNGTILKLGIKDMDTTYFNLLRFSLISIITLPWLFKGIKSVNKQNLKYAFMVGWFLWIAVMTYIKAIQLSSASYASLITLITPVFFIFYSVKLSGEKVPKRAVAGITLAALGAFAIIFLPIALSQDTGFQFYPMATLLLIINCLTYPLSSIAWKKAHESGLSLYFVLSLSSSMIAVLCFVYMLIFPPSSLTVDQQSLLAIIFSAVCVAIVARVIKIEVYEKLGSVLISGLGYLETFLAILTPVIVLGEKLSLATVFGGILILLGVYIIEHHKSEHHKYFHILRNH